MGLGWVTSFICLLLVAISIGGCAKPVAELSSSVEEISDSSLYQAVVMVIQPGGAGMCTGTFISPRTVLTAAHCTLSSGTYRIITNFGTFSTSQKSALGPGVLDDPNDLAILILADDYASRADGQVYPLGDQAETGETVRLIGFGCNSLDTRRGSGIKRTGTNVIYSVSDYIEMLTSNFGLQSQRRDILGPVDQAASCYGDSGGPLLRESGNYYSVVGVTHAGGQSEDLVLSQYVDVNRTENMEFLHSKDAEYSLGIFDGCNPEDSLGEAYCGSGTASIQILSFLQKIWSWCLSLLSI